MEKHNSFRFLILLVLTVFILSGCMLPAAHVTISPHVQLSAIKTVAV